MSFFQSVLVLFLVGNISIRMAWLIYSDHRASHPDEVSSDCFELIDIWLKILAIVSLCLLAFSMMLISTLSGHIWGGVQINTHILISDCWHPWVNYILLLYFLIIIASQAISWSVELYHKVRTKKDPFKIQVKPYWFERWLGRELMLKFENWCTIAVAVVWFLVWILTIA